MRSVLSGIMFSKLSLISVLICLCYADKDDKKWVWGQKDQTSARSNLNPNTRYDIFEEVDESPGFSNYHPTAQQIPSNQRPNTPLYENHRPVVSTGFVPPPIRPGGLYGSNAHRPTYGHESNNYQETWSGQASTWVEGGPIKNFDKCKCTQKFNCNSPGISYGTCDVGKQYCCYSTKRDSGSPLPSKPVHSYENGILVGPGGPVDPVKHTRPPKQLEPGFKPAYYGENQYGGRPGSYKEPNEYSPEYGVLVGPGGPHDTFGLGRSAKHETGSS